MEKRPHLSATQIEMYLRCPHQWYQRYILKKRRPPGAALVIGKGYDAGVTHNYQQKIVTGKDLQLGEVLDAVQTNIREQFNDGVDLNKRERGPLTDKTVALTTMHHTHLAPRVQPAAVQQKVVVDLGEEVGFDLLGYIDLIEADGTIVDNKTAGRKWSQDKADKSVQATAYSAAQRAITGKIEPGLRFDVAVKTTRPAIQQVKTTRTRGEIDWFLRLAAQVGKGIKAGVFPYNPNSNLCSEKWCGYWSDCLGAARKE